MEVITSSTLVIVLCLSTSDATIRLYYTMLSALCLCLTCIVCYFPPP
jgi:hypothetical protein